MWSTTPPLEYSLPSGSTLARSQAAQPVLTPSTANRLPPSAVPRPSVPSRPAGTLQRASSTSRTYSHARTISTSSSSPTSLLHNPPTIAPIPVRLQSSSLIHNSDSPFHARAHHHHHAPLSSGGGSTSSSSSSTHTSRPIPTSAQRPSFSRTSSYTSSSSSTSSSSTSSDLHTIYNPSDVYVPISPTWGVAAGGPWEGKSASWDERYLRTTYEDERDAEVVTAFGSRIKWDALMERRKKG